MSARNETVWSCVGSAGAVNPPDMGKVVLIGSIVQLGPGAPELAARATGPRTQAVIRYGVTAVADYYPNNPIPRVKLEILCRMGNGQIAARFVQVTMSGPQQSVTETTLVQWQAQAVEVDHEPNLFSTQTNFAPGVRFDFVANAYYVEVVLSAPANVVTEYPPAVSAIQLVFYVDG